MRQQWRGLPGLAMLAVLACGCSAADGVQTDAEGADAPAVSEVSEADAPPAVRASEQAEEAEREPAATDDELTVPDRRGAKLALASSQRSAGKTAEAQSGPADRDAASKSKPLPVYRPSTPRPQHDDAMLKRRFGVDVYESQRLRLYTDIDPATARGMPPLIDQAWQAWVDYFGPLPPDREGTDFQITGYLIEDRAALGDVLIPRDLPPFINGRHRGAEFWMYEQQYHYYRRHLVVHEATHCYMTIMPDVDLPVWYLEGMAELFGTHRIDADGRAHFRVMPHNEQDFDGLGRMALVQADVDAGRMHTLEMVGNLQPRDFLKNEAYAWSWALCYFLDNHPRYRDRFHELARDLAGDFPERVRQAYAADLLQMNFEWMLFARHLAPGYDFARCVVDLERGARIGASQRVTIAADRFWQTSGIELQKGRQYEVTAEGTFTLANEPKPWVSTADGISFRYNDGEPLGRLMGTLYRPDDTGADSLLLQSFPIGGRRVITAPETGTLYLRLNDFCGELADNSGSVQVTIRPVR